ncbi:hypothetical protein LCGC14_1374870, partial [marine sediment metagenome]
TGFSALQSISKDFKLQKTIIHNIVSQKLPTNYYLDDTVADETYDIITKNMEDVIKLARVSTIPENRKQSMKEKFFNRLEKLKKSHAYGAIGLFGAGLLGPEMLLIGAPIAGASLAFRKIDDYLTKSRKSISVDKQEGPITILDILRNFDPHKAKLKINNEKTFKPLIKTVIQTYITQVTENLKKDLNYDLKSPLGKFYLTTPRLTHLHMKKISNLVELISSENKGKYRWWGYTYNFKVNLDSQHTYFQAGFSTLPGEGRLGYYLHDLISGKGKSKFSSGATQIYGLLRGIIDTKFGGLDGFRDSTGHVDGKLLEESLKIYTDFEITGVFWSDDMMRTAEDMQTYLGNPAKFRKSVQKKYNRLFDTNKIIDIFGIDKDLEGKGLNEQFGGGGDPKVYSLLPYVAAYATLGYEDKQIHKRLVETGLKWNFKKFRTFIEREFGSDKNLLETFKEPSIKLLEENGFSRVEIRRFYQDSRLDIRFNNKEKVKFIELLKKGASLGEMINGLGFDKTGNIKTDSAAYHRAAARFIDEEYSYLPFDPLNKKRPGILELRNYLLAPDLLSFMLDDLPLTNKVPSTVSAVSLSGFSKEVIENMVKYNFGYKYSEIVDLLAIKGLRNLIVETHPLNVKNIPNHAMAQFYKVLQSRYKIKGLVEDFILNEVPGLISPDSYKKVQYKGGITWKELDYVKVAVIGPILQQAYRLNWDDTRIINTYGFFSNAKQLEDWTRFLYGTTPNGARFWFRTFLLKPEYYKSNFGVRIYTPRL